MKLKLFHLLFAVAILGVICWLAIPKVVAVSDGRFALTLNLPTSTPATSNLLVAYCWNRAEASHAEKHGTSTNEITFRPVDTNPDGTIRIDIPFSAKHESGREVSYHEPKYIVIQFGHDETLRRKMYDIPDGRRDRSISIDFD